MNRIILKCLIIGTITIGGGLSNSHAQDDSVRPKPSPDQYEQHSQQITQQQKQQSSGDENPQSSYDPMAGHHKYQHSSGLMNGFKDQINPCNRDYSVVIDGWHDAAFLLTIKSMEWWFCVVLVISFLTVLIDDVWRKMRMSEQREAFAGAALLFLNERTFAVKKANEAIFKHNQIIHRHDRIAQEGATGERIKEAMAVRSAVIQSTQMPEVVPDESNDYVDREKGNAEISVVSPWEAPTTAQEENNTSDNNVDKAEVDQTNPGQQPNNGNIKMATIKIGRTEHKVPSTVQLHIGSLTQKIENQRQRIHQLEEQLGHYENR